MSPIPFFHPLTASPSKYEAVWQNFLKWAEGFFPVLLKSALILVIGWWLAKFLTKLVASPAALWQAYRRPGRRGTYHRTCFEGQPFQLCQRNYHSSHKAL